MAKGTRIIMGNQAVDRRNVLNNLIYLTSLAGFQEITIPIIEKAELYVDKAGPEILNQMYVFKDKGNRNLCLRPEGTATIQALVKKHFKTQKDVKLFYFTPCYRYESPQAGRYREFYQFGVEWLNPSDYKVAKERLINLARVLVEGAGIKWEQYWVNDDVKRGLDYYTEGGFEFNAEELGTQSQIVGGGRYDNGMGFAIGFDRLMLLKNNRKVIDVENRRVSNLRQNP